MQVTQPGRACIWVCVCVSVYSSVSVCDPFPLHTAGCNNQASFLTQDQASNLDILISLVPKQLRKLRVIMPRGKLYLYGKLGAFIGT